MKNLWIAALAAVLLVSCGGRESQNRNKQTTKTEKKMGVQHLTKAEFLTKVANYEASPKEWKFLGDKPCIVDFWASWCGPCKMLGPTVEQVADDYAGKAAVGKVNVDDCPDLAERFGIMTIPAIFVFKAGAVVDKMVGIRQKAQLAAVLDKYL